MGDEATDDVAVTVHAIEHTFSLQAMELSKSDLRDSLKTYFQFIRGKKKAAGVPPPEIKAFMAGAPAACKFLLGKCKDCEILINSEFNMEGALTLREWSEAGNIYYYIRDGLDVQKC